MTLQEFCDLVATSAPSNALQATLWAVPAIQSVHILALSVVLASMGMFCFRLLGLTGRAHSLPTVARFYIPPTWMALAVLLLSGSLLILAEPERQLLNPAFRWKMALLLVAVITLGMVQRRLGRIDAGAVARPIARGVVLIFLSLWIAVAILGRWIAYVEPGL